MTISKALQIFISKGRKIKKFKAQGIPKSAPAVKPLTYSAKDRAIFSNVQHKISTSANIARQDKAARVASHIEHRSLREGLRRIRTKSLSIFGTSGYKVKKAGTNFSIKTPKAKRAIKSFNKAAAKVTIIARKKGEKAYATASTKLGVGRRFYGVRKPKQGFMDVHERKMTGMPPAELSSDMKAFYAGQRPSSLVKKHRKTLSKIYTQPKSWRERSRLVSHYKGQIKSELKQAKIDRDLFRGTTVQKITGEKTFWRKGGYVSKPRKVTTPITKTVMSPEKSYDVVSKRWKRTRPI